MDQNVIAIIGVVIGIPSFYIAYRDIIEKPRKNRKEILDSLNSYKAETKDEFQNLVTHGLALSDLDSSTTMDLKYFYKALKTLYLEGKIDVCIVNAIIENSHQDIQYESKAIIPYFVKGLLPPHLRASKQEVLKLIDDYRNFVANRGH